jgi:DNA primase large subunit
MRESDFVERAERRISRIVKRQQQGHHGHEDRLARRCERPNSVIEPATLPAAFHTHQLTTNYKDVIDPHEATAERYLRMLRHTVKRNGTIAYGRQGELIPRYQPQDGVFVDGYKDWDGLWTAQHHIEACRLARSDPKSTAEAVRVTLEQVLKMIELQFTVSVENSFNVESS